VGALDLTGTWPVGHAAVVVLHRGTIVGTRGDLDRVLRVASVTKLLAAWAVLIATEEGTVALDDAVGPPGATLADLLAHSAGCPFDGDAPIAPPRTRRTYSNTGYEIAAEHVARTSGMPFHEYLAEAVFTPLGMTTTRLPADGSAAKDVRSCAADLALFAAELAAPRLISPETLHHATSPWIPYLAGVVPGVGRFDPCPWGLGPELKGAKHPHWMGGRVSPSTYGHFGGSGSFVWCDPRDALACVLVSDTGFDTWGMTHWPRFNDAVVEEFGGER
jgi:CubicO group peptidase (beta-lactamase class C family)